MPIYQTNQDKINQEDVLKRIAYSCACDYTPSNTVTDPYDGSLTHNGKPIALVEVKCRNISRQAYSTFKIDKSKIDKLHTIATQNQLPAYLAVRFNDALGVLGTDIIQARAIVSEFFRKDRNDVNDRDVAYEFSNDLWKVIEGT